MTNIKKIKNMLSAFDIDAMLLTSGASRLYATGFMSTAGVVLVTSGNAWFIVDSRYSEAAHCVVTDTQVTPLNLNEKFEDRVFSLLSGTDVSKIGFEDKIVPYSTHNKWADKFNPMQLVPAQGLINNLRNVKSRGELNKMIKAQRLSEKIFREIIPLISTKITERELAAEIIYRAYKNGADKESFDPIVVSGKNSSRPHGVPGNDKIMPGFLTIDFGVILDGWCSDTTRTLCVGQPDDEMIRVYQTVLAAQMAGINAVRSGINAADADAAARNVIVQAGYGDYFGHAFSHSLGLEVHEFLSASPSSKDILPAGAVISAEPGIYIPGRYGVRIEDTLYVTDDGCENITALPKELLVIDI